MHLLLVMEPIIKRKEGRKDIIGEGREVEGSSSFCIKSMLKVEQCKLKTILLTGLSHKLVPCIRFNHEETRDQEMHDDNLV